MVSSADMLGILSSEVLQEHADAIAARTEIILIIFLIVLFYICASVRSIYILDLYSAVLPVIFGETHLGISAVRNT